MTNEASLLNQVINIDKKYKEIAKITGDNFNIFQILKLDSKETSLHSLVLAELLNPKGKHGLANKPLDLFISQFPNSGISGFDSTNAIVSVEKYIGDKNKDETEGGRIDIIIENNQKSEAIIIENKIYAGDQKNQLYRYYSFAKRHYKKNFHLFYLTLYPSTPSDYTTNASTFVKEKCVPISYESTIINWLEACKQESVNYPLLRETITQYIILLKHLTDQSTNKKMSAEIQNEIIQSENAVKAAKAIRESLNNLENDSDHKTKLIFDLLEKSKPQFYSDGINQNLLEITHYKEGKEARSINITLYPKQEKMANLTTFISLTDFKWQAEIEGSRATELSELSNTICAQVVRFDIKTSNEEMLVNLTSWIKEFIEKAK